MFKGLSIKQIIQIFLEGESPTLRLISKFMTPQSGQQIITMHYLSNTSRNKGKQTMKFVHLIKYKIRNIFLKKSYKKCVGLVPVPFLKNEN